MTQGQRGIREMMGEQMRSAGVRKRELDDLADPQGITPLGIIATVLVMLTAMVLAAMQVLFE